MADPPRPQDPGDDTASDRDGRRATRVAPWQIVVGVVGLLVVLGIVVLLLAGDHGPGRHAPADDTGQASAAGAPEATMTATEPAFVPDRLELVAGEPLNLTLVDAGDVAHDWDLA